ncbi:MAG: SUMF1/EgtB/PvdO family nonheme iron enzyme [Nitrospirae bacterium]|nr:SUMF1/EgtB/PvdO family nonheme iron enzyme [Nitrospirota bacterium]
MNKRAGARIIYIAVFCVLVLSIYAVPIRGQGQGDANTVRYPEFVSGSQSVQTQEIPEQVRDEKIEKPLQEATRQTESDEMVLVKGGCFDMGDVSAEGDPDEIPVHKACVDDFYIGIYEVTQRHWFKVMGTAPSSLRNCDDCPVENVSYYDIQKFILKLNRISGGKYRLPTEAEWEFAARSGGERQKWCGANNEMELNDYAWFKSNSGIKPHPVGKKKANGLGLYDMCGNIQEWVNDYYEGDYYKTSPRSNPQGPLGSQYRAARGGSFLNGPWGIRTSIRYRFTKDDLGREFGFRLAASLK